MILPCCPRIKRCCFCLKNLRLASVFIAVWSMLASCHSIRLLLWPVCENRYKEDNSSLRSSLIYTMWILFVVNMLTALASFGLLLGMFFLKKLYFTADIFVLCGLLTAVLSFTHGILTFVDYDKCSDLNDGITFFVYGSVWCYFIMVVNSCSAEIREIRPRNVGT